MVQVVAQESAAGLAEELELVRGQELGLAVEVAVPALVQEQEPEPVGVLVQELVPELGLVLVEGQERALERVREVVAEELVPEREQVPVGVLVQELAEVEVRQLLHGLPQICHLEARRVRDNPRYLGYMQS